MTYIGLIVHRYPPAIGGVEQHVWRVASGLALNGCRVDVITTDPSGELAPVEQRDGVTVRRFRTLGRNTVYYLSPALGDWLVRNAARYDVLHAHSYHTPLALQAAVAAHWHHKPFFLTTHYHGTGHSLVRRALHVPYRPLGRLALSTALRVLCVSEVERALLQKHFGQKLPVVVVPNGVDIARIQAAAPFERPRGHPLVLSVGRLEAYKQTMHLVEALKHLPEPYELVIIGDGPMRGSIERAIQHTGLAGRVQMLANLSQDALYSWLRSADVFVTLSQHEAFGIAALEAAVAGAPVIASDIPAHREVGTYLPPNQLHYIAPHAPPPAVASLLMQLYDANQAADGRTQARRDLSRVPTWEGAVRATLACYDAALGTASAANPTPAAEVS